MTKQLDPVQEQEWLDEQEQRCISYLSAEHLPPSEEIEIEWCLPPYVAIWSAHLTDGKQIWIISGDLPTDFIDNATLPTARDAVRAFSQRWKMVSEAMLQGKQHSAIKIGDRNNPAELRKLGELLQSRASLLHTFSENPELWSKCK